MFELYLPYILGVAMGITPPQGEAVIADATAATEELTPVDEGSGDDMAAREPEAQVPTGKYTTALEVKPILGMTKSNWAAVRLYEGQDLVYFSHLMAWRCGLWDIRYGVNGAPADQVMPMEPCNEQFQQPNVMVDIENFPPYVIFSAESIETIYIEVTFDDGTTDFAQFNRNEILIP